MFVCCVLGPRVARMWGLCGRSFGLFVTFFGGSLGFVMGSLGLLSVIIFDWLLLVVLDGVWAFRCFLGVGLSGISMGYLGARLGDVGVFRVLVSPSS